MRGVDECDMIRNLPEGLRRDIKYHLCLDLVRQVPLFQHMDSLVLGQPFLQKLAVLGCWQSPSLDAIAIRQYATGVLPPVTPLQKQESSPGQNGDIRSPKRICTENRSVFVERNSFTLPVKDRLLAINNLNSKLLPPALHSAFSSPTRPNPGGGGETCAETTIKVFFGKAILISVLLESRS